MPLLRTPRHPATCSARPSRRSSQAAPRCRSRASGLARPVTGRGEGQRCGEVEVRAAPGYEVPDRSPPPASRRAAALPVVAPEAAISAYVVERCAEHRQEVVLLGGATSASRCAPSYAPPADRASRLRPGQLGSSAFSGPAPTPSAGQPTKIISRTGPVRSRRCVTLAAWQRLADDVTYHCRSAACAARGALVRRFLFAVVVPCVLHRPRPTSSRWFRTASQGAAARSQCLPSPVEGAGESGTPPSVTTAHRHEVRARRDQGAARSAGCPATKGIGKAPPSSLHGPGHEGGAPAPRPQPAPRMKS